MASRAGTGPQCPFAQEDARKTARIAQRGGLVRDPVRITEFADARAVLRSGEAEQAGFLSDLARRYSRMKQPILFLSGEEHRRQRKATARFFAPKVVTGRYRDLIRAETERLIARLRRNGSAALDALSLDLAVTVAAEIVGLTESDPVAMAGRLETITGGGDRPRWAIMKLVMMMRRQWQVRHFLREDVRPAIAARKAAPRDDVISHLIAEGYNDQEILVECLTYGAAGMITTREFITMAGWRMMEEPALRARFMAADDADRIVLLEEILRVEPVVGMIYRRLPGREGVLGIDVRAANADESVAGACPYAVDPERGIEAKYGHAVMAFGDGEHRCPGAQVAMHETAIFLEALFKVPGLRLERAPDVGWNALITGYELRGALLTCDRAD
ncbi:cytochrome P450 [Caenibius sp. WL]|uniref:cytochrome P450 n=1 Tax=Caenibius sp. WL TaxID=2872646 RepID=UPI001E6EC60F|nr:cytochrome P450 [Caenibius sp. WL]QZP08497.1 cytochrome P450 [Caenibius sp. WL]